MSPDPSNDMSLCHGWDTRGGPVLGEGYHHAACSCRGSFVPIGGHEKSMQEMTKDKTTLAKAVCAGHWTLDGTVGKVTGRNRRFQQEMHVERPVPTAAGTLAPKGRGGRPPCS